MSNPILHTFPNSLCLPVFCVCPFGKKYFSPRPSLRWGKALKRGSWWDLKCGQKKPRVTRLDASWCRGWWSLGEVNLREKVVLASGVALPRAWAVTQEHESYPRFTFSHLSILELREQVCSLLVRPLGLHKSADHLLWENPVTWVPESLDFELVVGVLAEDRASLSRNHSGCSDQAHMCLRLRKKWRRVLCPSDCEALALHSTSILGPRASVSTQGTTEQWWINSPSSWGKWTANSVSIRLWGPALSLQLPPYKSIGFLSFCVHSEYPGGSDG